jgi:short-subunit dehydrogenase
MKLYVITGAGQGIGFELVKQLLSDGHFVVWNEIDSSIMEMAIQHLNDLSFHNHVSILGDASSDAFLTELNQVLDQTEHELVGVVCNAGITTFGDFWSYQRSSMNHILQVLSLDCMVTHDGVVTIYSVGYIFFFQLMYSFCTQWGI